LGINLYSQKNDFTWLCGYAGGKGDPEFGISILRFHSGNLEVEFNPDIKMYLLNTNAVINDNDGNLMFYSNGEDVNNSLHQLINGASDLYKFSSGIGGIPLTSATLILNKPNTKDEYLIFYPVDSAFNLDPFGRVHTISLQYATIRIEKDNPKGILLNRDTDILRDTIWGTGFTACRHANGRDWWFLIGEKAPATGIYKILIEPDTILVVDKQLFPNYFIDGVSHACFSPNGEYYVRYTQYSSTVGGFINLYKFDRCNGALQLLKEISFFYNGLYGGVCFSPNSRKLYVGHSAKLYQLNLDDPEPWDSKALVDSIELIPPGGMSYTFFNNGPDDKIYMGTGGTQKLLHYINKPNLSGDSCEIKTKGISLQNYNASTPNFPHFRLGPVDGSICDSLGLDNIPLCNWRHEQDTINHLNFKFLDLSAYGVEQWSWSFGDINSISNTSTDKNPFHQFSGNGIFTVCLNVKNSYGNDTLCRNIKIGNMVKSEDEQSEVDYIQIWPNPCIEDLIINVHKYNPEKLLVSLYNQYGALVITQRLYVGSNFINMQGLQSGVYYVSILEKGLKVKHDKIVKFK
jgi:hypothetical protein